MNKKYYSVLPKSHKMIEMEVIMMATTKEIAVKLYEAWNGPNYKLTKKDMRELGLEVRKIKMRS